MFLHAPLLEQQEAHARRRQQQQQQEAGAAADTIPVDGEPPAAGPRRIEAGDMVIVYENINSAKFVYVERDAVFRNRYGTFRHNDWIGTPFGARVTAHSRVGATAQRGYGHGGGRGGGGRGGDPRPGRDSAPIPAGFVHLLAPTPELWTVVLRHRTQILYVADISLVVSELELRPGGVVLEAGTGSGSLTHALARAVAPSGRVASFEFHAVRAAEAADELRRHGLSDVASVTLRDVEADGFPGPARPADGGFFVADGAADAVFLDLPGPWRVVPAVARVLRPGGRFCGFSPCVEQVQRTAAALDARGFREVRTVEVLLRLYDVVSVPSAASFAAAAADGGAGRGNERGGRKPGEFGRKRARADEGAAAAGGAAEGGAAGAAEGGAAGAAEGAAAAAAEAAAPRAPRRVQCWPQAEARGHTGYLTFATKFAEVPGLEEEDGGAKDEEEEEADEDEEDEGEGDDDDDEGGGDDGGGGNGGDGDDG